MPRSAERELTSVRAVRRSGLMRFVAQALVLALQLTMVPAELFARPARPASPREEARREEAARRLAADPAARPQPQPSQPESPARLVRPAGTRSSHAWLVGRLALASLRSLLFRLSPVAPQGGGGSPAQTTRSHAYPAGWSLVAVPLHPADARATAVFDELPAPLRLYDTANGQTVSPEEPGFRSVVPGRAFWALLESPATVSATGTLVSTTTPQAVPLQAGWNAVSTPWLTPVDWTDAGVSVRRGTQTVPLGDAVTLGWLDPTLDVHDPATDTFTAFPPNATPAGQLRPWQGALVFAHVPADLVFSVPSPDTTPPVVSFAAPAEGAEIGTATDIVGTADDPNLLQWSLDVAFGSVNPFTPLATGEAPVDAQALTTLDPTLLENGPLRLRLTATDVAGNQASVERTVLVAGTAKVGVFRLAFRDLQVPVAGVPITVTRVYDSRARGSRSDFGFGWSLEIEGEGVYLNNRKPGDGWAFNTGALGLPCIGATVPTKSHYTEIRFSDQESYRFALQVQGPAPILGGCTGTARFVQVAGVPGARLDILGGVDVFWQAGGDTLVELDTFEVYEPSDVRLTTAAGRSYDLGLHDGLRRVADANGNAVSITPTGIIHSSGRSIQILRDGQGRVTSVVDPLGHAIVYGYDSAGDLVSVTDREENETTITYDAAVAHLLHEIKDPLGRTPIRNDYDEDGRLISATDAFGKPITFEHDLEGRRETITDREGAVRVIEYDDRGNNVKEVDREGKVVLRSFDARDNVTSVTEAHEPGDPDPPTTTFGYDGRDNILAATDPEGNVTAFTFNARNQELTVRDPRGTYTVNTYDSNGNLLTQKVATAPDGPALAEVSVTRWPNGALRSRTEVVDGVSCATQYEYDVAGNLSKETDPLGRAITFTYDAGGNPATQTVTRTIGGSPQTLVTQYEYDRQGRLTKTIDPDGSFTRTVYDELGRPKETYDGLGRKTTQVYDDMGRVTQTAYADGTTEEFAYDAEGRRLTARDRAGRLTTSEYSRRGELEKTTFPDASFTVNLHDAAGRVVTVTDARGQARHHAYDLAGRVTSTRVPLGGGVFAETAYTYDEGGNVLTVKDPNGETTSSQYDPQGRPTRRVFPDGTFTETTYDSLGRKRFERDQAGKTTEFRYDCLGQLVKVIDAAGKETSYAYDEGGLLVSATDANGRLTRFEYDRAGQQARRILPDGSFETKTYDAAGNLTTRTDFAGRVTTYAYDLDDRVLSRSYPDSAQDVDFTYTPSGLRRTATDGRGTTTYDYDLRDRLTAVTYPDGRTLEYGWDGNGNRTTLRAGIGPLTLATGYTYDEANRLDAVTDPAGRAYDHGYDPNGNRTALLQPNGAATAYQYDRLNRLTRLTTGHAATGQTVQAYTLTLGAAGNRERIEEHGGTVRDYGYDALYRVITERVSVGGTLDYEKTFTYDFVGNRLAQTTVGRGAGSQAYTYDTRDRLLTDGLSSYTYDDNGNLLTRSGDATYTWDLENRLVRVVKTDGTVQEIAYDADGNRVQTRVTPATGPPTVEDLLVDPSGPLSQVVAETDAVGALRAYYVRGDDLLAVMRPDAAGPGGWATRFYHADALGSVRRLTDESGAVTDTYEYTAFGELLTHTGTDPQPYAFAGEPLDPNVGFQYHRARWMDPRSGRFLGMDPFAGSPFDPVSLHRYLYANADPVGHVDPTGQFSLGSVACSFAIAGTINAMMTAVFSLFTGQSITVTDLWQSFVIGGLTAPVGGFLVRAFAPLIRASLQPLLAWFGALKPITLLSKSGFQQWLVKVSRYLFTTNKHHPPVTSTTLGKVLKWAFPDVQWEQSHIFIQQSWTSARSGEQIYKNLLANEGLRRFGNGVWNLLPLPRSLNNWLGRRGEVHKFATQMVATAYYSIIVFGGWHTVSAVNQ